METKEYTAFRFNDFEVDAERRLLLKEGKTVKLNPKAFDLLLVLLKNQGKIITKNELLDRVWEDQFVEENNLTVHITALRKALGETSKENRFIVTVPGKGYKFVGQLNFPNNGELIVETHQLERIVVDEEVEAKPVATKQLSSRPRNHILAIILGGLILTLGLGVWFFLNRSSVTAAPIESIAVLPFVYEGGNAETEYLADGMTESLINHLSTLPKLTVKARNSVFRFKGKAIEPEKAAGELSVQTVLLGKIVERNGNFILSLELVDGKTGNHIWGEQYHRRATDLAILQSDIARDVTNKLHLKLTGGRENAKGHTKSAEAYELYLKGRFFFNKRQPEEHKKAIALFEQAIKLDPNYALAYSAIGDCYSVRSSPLPLEQASPIAKQMALKALSIEPDLGEAYSVLGNIEDIYGNWTEAEKYYRKSIELNPGYASARQWYAEVSTTLGRHEEAIREIEEAFRLDPFSNTINFIRTYVYTFARQYEKAEEQGRKALELDPNWLAHYDALLWGYEHTGKYEKVLELFETFIKLYEKDDAKVLVIQKRLKKYRTALKKDGERGYWKTTLEEALIELGEGQDLSFRLAECYARLGDKENAIKYLKKAREKHPVALDVRGVKVNPNFDSLKDEPRFHKILRSINLEPNQ